VRPLKTLNSREYLNMKIIVFLLAIALFMFTQKLDAQNIDESNIAIQFQIYNPLRLIPFQGGVLSAKYQFLNRYSFRFGFGVYSNFEFEEQFNGYKYVGENNYRYSFSSQIIYNSTPTNDVSVYFGGGPYFSHLHYDYSGKYLVEKEIGFSVILGVEWFFVKNISIHGESGLQIAYNIYNNEDYYGGPLLVKSFRIYDYNTFKIGLSVYL